MYACMYVCMYVSYIYMRTHTFNLGNHVDTWDSVFRLRFRLGLDTHLDLGNHGDTRD